MIIYNSELYHYGVPRRSGRYKWGSGKNPFRHRADGGSLRPALRTRMLVKQSEKAHQKGNDREAFTKINRAIDLQAKHYGRRTGDLAGIRGETSPSYAKLKEQRLNEINANNNKYPNFEKHPNRKLSEQYMRDADAIMSKYRKRLKRQQLVDIGYKDIQQGMKLYKKYDFGY